MEKWHIMPKWIYLDILYLFFILNIQQKVTEATKERNKILFFLQLKNFFVHMTPGKKKYPVMMRTTERRVKSM